MEVMERDVDVSSDGSRGSFGLPVHVGDYILGGASGSEYQASEKNDDDDIKQEEQDPEPSAEVVTSSRRRTSVKKSYVESSPEHGDDMELPAPPRKGRRALQDVDDDNDEEEVTHVRRSTRPRGAPVEDDDKDEAPTSGLLFRSRNSNKNLEGFVVSDDDDRRYNTRSRTKPNGGSSWPQCTGGRATRNSRRAASKRTDQDVDFNPEQHSDSDESMDAEGSLDDAPRTSSEPEPESEPERDWEPENASLIKKEHRFARFEASRCVDTGICSVQDSENNTARETAKLATVIQVPFRSGNQFLGEGGLKDIYYATCDKTSVIADQHADLGRTIGKLATSIVKEREQSTRLVGELDNGISMFKNTPMNLEVKSDP
ncbi:hypothetical protein BJ165DRAFT_1403436 [Panaeolus papilionaceus]|nr:hypothetical protein BJ165DRAFT_1403436 [Panaeolus papilionaceus]